MARALLPDVVELLDATEQEVLLAPDDGRQQLPTDQVTAEDEEQIDTDPAETMRAAGKREAHNPGVVNDHNDDGEENEVTGSADIRRRLIERGLIGQVQVEPALYVVDF